MAPAARLAELLDAAKAPENRGIVYGLAAAATAVAGLALLYKKSQAPPKKGRFADAPPLGKDEYLAVIVGAGPSGSACGYYLASEGHKVVLLDKARFPRGALKGRFARKNPRGLHLSLSPWTLFFFVCASLCAIRPSRPISGRRPRPAGGGRGAARARFFLGLDRRRSTRARRARDAPADATTRGRDAKWRLAKPASAPLC